MALPALVVGVVASSREADWSPWWLVLLLAVLCLAAEISSVHGGPGRWLDVSGSSIVTFCAVVLLGPAPGACMAALAVGIEGLVHRRWRGDTLSNVGNYAAFALAGGLLATPLLSDARLTVASAIAAVGIYGACEVISFLLAVGWRWVRRPEGHRFEHYARQFVTVLPSLGAGAMLAVIAVWTYRTAGGVALGLLGAALLLVQRLLSRLVLVELELRAERDRARAYLDSAGSPFVILDADRRIEKLNRRAQSLLGSRAEELAGRRWEELLCPDDRDEFADALLRAGKEPIQVEGRLAHLGVREHVVLWSVARLESEQILLSGEDITERRDAERKLEYLAFHDPLTRLPNRTAFAAALTAARDLGHGLAVLFIDLDGFKAVNDLHGHATGDAVLCHAARRLQSGVRDHDVVARQSGDEFLVLLDDLPRDAADARVVVEHVVERMLAALADPYAVAGADVCIEASVGVALHPRDGDEPETLISAADREMYAQKALVARAIG